MNRVLSAIREEILVGAFHGSSWINGIGPILPPPTTKNCILLGFDRYEFEKFDVDTDICGLTLLRVTIFNILKGAQMFL